ncbi:hypothetical protein AMJ44_08810, partial [candidate division WOR-1 bacterium DG_54_3]
PQVVIDAELEPLKISMGLIKELEVLDPQGEGNPPPVFVSRNLDLADVRRVGSDGKHLKLKLSDGEISLDTIGFNLGNLADINWRPMNGTALRLRSCL